VIDIQTDAVRCPPPEVHQSDKSPSQRRGAWGVISDVGGSDTRFGEELVDLTGFEGQQMDFK